MSDLAKRSEGLADTSEVGGLACQGPVDKMIWGLGWAMESGPRTHVLNVFSALGQREAQEGSTTTPGGAPSLNSDRFCMIFG